MNKKGDIKDKKTTGQYVYYLLYTSFLREYSRKRLVKRQIQINQQFFFTKVLTNRISATLDSNWRKEQTGFRSGYSTSEYSHIINQVVEK